MTTKHGMNEDERRKEAAWVGIIQQHVASLRYGTVEIVVHDSRVIQIQRTERVRLDKGLHRTDADQEHWRRENNTPGDRPDNRRLDE